MLEGIHPLWAFVAVVALGAPLLAVIGLRMRPLRVIDFPTEPPSPARFRPPAQSAAPPLAQPRGRSATRAVGREAIDVALHALSWSVPLMLAAAPSLLIAASLSPAQLVATQARVWYVVTQPLGFIVYVASIGMLLRSGPTVSIVPPLARRAVRGVALLVLGTMGAYVFLGGDGGWVLPPFAWLLIKVALIAATATGLGGLAERASRPRTATRLAWTIALPIAVLNLAWWIAVAWLESPH